VHFPLVHWPPQHWAFVVHAPAMGTQGRGGSQLPLTHRPPQQSAFAVHAAPLALHGAEHTPLTQLLTQHCEARVQTAPMGKHAGGGGRHRPATQLKLQQLPSTVHVAPLAAHGVVQRWVVVLHTPRQHSALVVHVEFWALQVLGPNSHRGGSRVSSHTVEQQPFCGPELQVSPVPRHVVFAGSSWHCPL